MIKRIGKIKNTELTSVYEIDKTIYKSDNYPIFVLRQFYDLFPDLFLVARNESNEVIGYAIGGINEMSGWILAIGTSKESRKQGIGNALMVSLLNELKDQTIKEILLTVEPGNSAIKLYESFNFVEVEEIHNYYGNNQNRIIMRKSLD